MVSYVGDRAISAAPMPAAADTSTIERLRPWVSAMCPKMMPPSGRARKPTAKTSQADSCEANGSFGLKNCVEKNGRKVP